VNGGGWVIDEFSMPAGTTLDYVGKEEHQLTPYERLARGRVPPIDACALDWDCALVMHRNYHPDFHDRLHRRLSQYDEEMFQRIISGKLFSEEVLQRYWPRGKG
jgi:hypothetical protein